MYIWCGEGERSEALLSCSSQPQALYCRGSSYWYCFATVETLLPPRGPVTCYRWRDSTAKCLAFGCFFCCTTSHYDLTLSLSVSFSLAGQLPNQIRRIVTWLSLVLSRSSINTIKVCRIMTFDSLSISLCLINLPNQNCRMTWLSLSLSVSVVQLYNHCVALSHDSLSLYTRIYILLINQPITCVPWLDSLSLYRQAELPVNSTTLKYGTSDAAKTVHNEDKILAQGLKQAGKALNVRTHVIKGKVGKREGFAVK